MRSRVASDVADIHRARVLAMTPADRVDVMIRLSAEGLASFMATHQVDRATARERIAATRRAGRPRSASSDRR